MSEVITKLNDIVKIPREDRSAVILCSGGLDSTSLLAHLTADRWKLTVLAIKYGSKHNAAEHAVLKENIEKHYSKHDFVYLDITDVGVQLNSSLLRPEKISAGEYNEENIKQTVVPGRNTMFLAIAMGIAQSKGHKYIAIANHHDDHGVYPDCRPEFISAMNNVVDVASEGSVRILAPFTYLTKADIVKVGARTGFPLYLTWSCYNGGTIQCGECSTCLARIAAFEKAGVNDLTEYIVSK